MPAQRSKWFSTTKKIAYNAIGIALFTAVSSLLPIPIPNTFAHIDLGYTIMTIFAYLFGPLSGFLVGGMGRIVTDLVVYGVVPPPGWWIASFAMGGLCGILFKYTKNYSSLVKRTLIYIIGICLVNVIFLTGLAAFISAIWNGVSYVAMLPTGLWAFLTDSIAMIVLGLPLSVLLNHRLSKSLKALT